MSYLTNIFYDTTENQNFRTVLFTGMHSQLVVMSIPPSGEIGMETHDAVEQTLFFLSGTGMALLNGERKEVHPGDALVIAPGTEHNVLNTGTVPLKLFTVYAPPNHLDGRVHATKADADSDREDEAFGSDRSITSSRSEFVPDFIPTREPRPEPANPLENPDGPAISIYAHEI